MPAMVDIPPVKEVKWRIIRIQKGNLQLPRAGKKPEMMNWQKTKTIGRFFIKVHSNRWWNGERLLSTTKLKIRHFFLALSFLRTSKCLRDFSNAILGKKKKRKRKKFRNEFFSQAETKKSRNYLAASNVHNIGLKKNSLGSLSYKMCKFIL